MVRPAMIEQRDMLIAYSAALHKARDDFMTLLTDTLGFEEAGALLSNSSVHAFRAWTQLTFGGQAGHTYRGGGRDVEEFGIISAVGRLQELYESGEAESLDVIFSDEWLGNHHRVMRARVTAAEAALLDNTMVRPESTQTRSEE